MGEFAALISSLCAWPLFSVLHFIFELLWVAQGQIGEVSATALSGHCDVVHLDGTKERLYLDNLKRGWKYIDDPNAKPIKDLTFDEENSLRGIACGQCGKKDVKLLACSRCYQIRYCSTDCQKKNWPTHKMVCRAQTALAPNPIYPLNAPDLSLGEKQLNFQNATHLFAMDVIRGNFEIAHLENYAFWAPESNIRLESDPKVKWQKITKIHDPRVLFMERYQVKTPNKLPSRGPVVFKVRSPESPEHSPAGPSACGFYDILSTLEKDIRYVEGGLHYLAYGGDDFVLMVMLYNSFGTCLPLTPGCYCNHDLVKWKALASKWDDMLRRIIADEYDVQCMFADVELKCQMAGRGCPFKHDLLHRKK